jgi:hypothetical protein
VDFLNYQLLAKAYESDKECVMYTTKKC